MSVTVETDLWRLSANELADLVRTRRVSSREVVEAHLARISGVNPAVNAVVVVLAQEALAAASDADRAVKDGVPLPPLHGVPFTVKENLDVAGTATTQGLKALAGAYPSEDAPAVKRLKAAGAIPIARTNMPSGAIRWHTESELWGTTINPWDRSRTPGASSAGEAVAVATGMSPLGLGSDGLGSLRHPAQCCGVATLKPTLGRIPESSSAPGTTPATIGMQITAVVGPIARRVADLRSAFEMLAGPTWEDPWSVPAPVRGPALEHGNGVALVVDPAGGGTASQVQDGIRKAGRVLADRGYAVDEVEPPGIEAAAEALVIMLSTPGIRMLWRDELPPLPRETLRFMVDFMAASGEPDVVTAEAAFMTRHAVLRQWGEFQRTRPLIVAPVATDVPALAGTDLEEGQVRRDLHTMRMATAVNALGLPAVVVPVGIQDGLPQVVQIIGPRYREDLCLDAAAAIEDRLGTLTPIDPM